MPRPLIKEKNSNFPAKRNVVFSPNGVDEKIAEVEDIHIKSGWEKNVTIQSQSSGDTPTSYRSRNIYEILYTSSVASTASRPVRDDVLNLIPKGDFVDDDKSRPSSPEVCSSATCLDFTSEDRKREYKFVSSDEKKEIKNVTIKYSDDGVVSASYSPPAFLPPSPVPVRTNMTSTYQIGRASCRERV